VTETVRETVQQAKAIVNNIVGPTLDGVLGSDQFSDIFGDFIEDTQQAFSEEQGMNALDQLKNVDSTQDILDAVIE